MNEERCWGASYNSWQLYCFKIFIIWIIMCSWHVIKLAWFVEWCFVGDVALDSVGTRRNGENTGLFPSTWPLLRDLIEFSWSRPCRQKSTDCWYDFVLWRSLWVHATRNYLLITLVSSISDINHNFQNHSVTIGIRFNQTVCPDPTFPSGSVYYHVRHDGRSNRRENSVSRTACW